MSGCDSSVAVDTDSTGYKSATKSLIHSVLTQLYGEGAKCRDGQEEAIIRLVDENNRFLLVQPAGYGKSVVYFTAASIIKEKQEKITVIVLPLVALARNQKETAQKQYKLESIIVDSSARNNDSWLETEQKILQGCIDVIFTTPEQLSSQLFSNPDLIGNIGLFVVDECHCYSDWGHDFRTSYLTLKSVVESLISSDVPILACTATANAHVEKDIKSLLRTTTSTLRGSLQLTKLGLHVLHFDFKKLQAFAWLGTHIPQFEGSGVIYCTTTVECETVAGWLRRRGESARAYYSGVRPFHLENSSQETNEYREELERQFAENKIRILVATSALSMGYDKHDIRFVILYGVPVSIAAIYQQIGRAGRGDDDALAVILCDNYGKNKSIIKPKDCRLQNYFLEDSLCSVDEVVQILEALGTDDSKGVTVDELFSKVNVDRNDIEKTLKILERDALVRNAQSNSWIRTKYMDNEIRRAYERARKDREAAKNKEWTEVVFPFLTTDENCLMCCITKELGEESDYECGKCSFCLAKRKQQVAANNVVATSSIAEQNMDKLQFSVKSLDDKFDPALLTAAIKYVKSSEKPLSLRNDLPLKAFEKYSKIDLCGQAEKGKILSSWWDAGWGQELGKLYYITSARETKLIATLANAVLEMYERWNPTPKPEWVTYIPSVRHPLVPLNVSREIAKRLELPFKEAIKFHPEKKPEERIKMKNDFFRCRNIDGSFDIDRNQIQSGPVLLVDYVISSGCTVSVVAALLRQEGCSQVTPLILAHKKRCIF